MLETDSVEYEILEEGVGLIKDVPGFTCEIGVRRGGGSEKIMRKLDETGQKERIHIGIDPYGNIDYQTTEDVNCRYGYSNQMFYEAMIGIYKVAQELNQHFLFFPFEDEEFFKKFNTGIPIYDYYKNEINEYALVHFDGPHAFEPVKNEFEFFDARCNKGSVFVFDDIVNYPHEAFENEFLFPRNWNLIRKGETKASYIKR